MAAKKWRDNHFEISEILSSFSIQVVILCGLSNKPQSKWRGEIIFFKIIFNFGGICGHFGVERTRANAREARIMGEASISFGTFHRDKGMIVRRVYLFL